MDTSSFNESRSSDATFGPAVHVTPSKSAPSIIVVCEHATNRVPETLGTLGLDAQSLDAHIAWDPGALGVAQALSQHLDAVQVHGGISRLVYDCNRPPQAHDAIPVTSEIFAIPANANLSEKDKAVRAANVYAPFRDMLSQTITNNRDTLALMVTVHSFTPIYRGQPRDVELGLLHGKDPRFATAMLAAKPASITLNTQLNAPYSATDGVAHTLDVHAAPINLLNVMLEIRNDLIQTSAQQSEIAEALALWISTTRDGFTS
ncbi:N-formylglutamate amidohydrolase [Shimia abyssi]|uniref:Putative N-formylglutamate amidohydrolase n=1 Tax=Shimia abyssi TaxID=1662395 RepID=A0A2P8FHI9_9RHOB|nr:N-formylglutamate amidohydrolase [Shimia abyssi]PSL21130.1 putative N-formylglutamate amidohydrolase [Shimia abyssi]